MKVAVIGGGGRVGICAAFALQVKGVVSEIILLDIAAQLVKGEALDLLHGSALSGGQRVSVGDYADAAAADIVVITAGLRRKPDEPRLALINRNVTLFRGIINDLKAAGLSENTVLLVVSNPVDILTYLAVKESGLPAHRVLGLGTLLDTSRFRSLIADAVGADPSQVNAMILGEHGDSMFPVWSTATIDGFALEGLSNTDKQKIFERTKTSGAEVLTLKGGAGWAVGVSIAHLVHAILLDQQKLLPVSALQTGAYKLHDVCISTPTRVGRTGVIDVKEIELWSKELQDLKRSAGALKDTLAKVEPA